jgi:hypothetical protein
MTEQDRTLELVRTILSLAKNIGVGVIAEGVETPVQRDMLADLGCPWGQGFLFSRALPAGELEDLLAGGPLLGPSGDATERPGSWARQLALWPVGSPDMPLGPPDELPDGLAASPVRWYKRSAGELATVTGSAS